MKINLILICLLFGLWSCQRNKAIVAEEDKGFTEIDFLQTKDTLVVNQNGEIIRLNGTNLGGWLLREAWMDPVGYFSKDSIGKDADDYLSRKIMVERFGKEKTEELLDGYQDIYISTSDLDTIAKIGLTFVRVPIYWQEILDSEGELKPGAFKQLDWIIKECKSRRIYVMLDLHGAPGGHSDGYQSGGQKGSNEFWTNPRYQEMTKKIWRSIAQKYKDEPTVMAYDLLNEPVSSNPSVLSVKNAYDQLYKTVRKIDSRHIIVMGAFYNFDVLTDPLLMKWENVIYQTHHYSPDNRKDKVAQGYFLEGVVNYLKTYKTKWNVPIYAGEYNFWEHLDLWEKWMNLLTDEGIIWSNWAYKNIDMDKDNNWGFFYANDNPHPDLLNDSPEQFIEKWNMFSTDHYVRNPDLINTVSNSIQYARLKYNNK